MGYILLYHFIFDSKMGEALKNIGKLSGKILLFGGVYSNLQSLQKLMDIAKDEGIPPENCICTGDLVGYCAQPEETVSLFRKWGAKSITGNVEIQLAEGKEDCGCDFREGSRCDNFSQTWFPYAKAHLSKDSIEWMQNLPRNIEFQFAGKKVTVVHGSLENVSEFIFKSTPWSLKENVFTTTNSDIIIAGHCGLPFHDIQDNKVWLNPGVIGMPANDGTPKVWYAILDRNEEHLFKHFSFKYNHKLTSELILKNYLSEEYARTIITGIWDNTEILPERETGLQGFGINL